MQYVIRTEKSQPIDVQLLQRFILPEHDTLPHRMANEPPSRVGIDEAGNDRDAVVGGCIVDNQDDIGSPGLSRDTAQGFADEMTMIVVGNNDRDP